jgi:hypothetical protein
LDKFKATRLMIRLSNFRRAAAGSFETLNHCQGWSNVEAAICLGATISFSRAIEGLTKTHKWALPILTISQDVDCPKTGKNSIATIGYCNNWLLQQLAIATIG